MKPTLTQMNKWFDEFNSAVFSNKLPKVKITFNNTRRQLGQFYWRPTRGIGIKISLFYDRKEEGFRNTLLHEMCHLYCYKQGWVHEGHGENWKRIADKAYRITGLYIQRTQTDEVFVPRGAENKAKMKAVKEKVSGVYICDSPRALRWQNSRSLNRGYKFRNWEYDKDIAPMLKKAVKIDNLRKLCWWGECDKMDIR